MILLVLRLKLLELDLRKSSAFLIDTLKKDRIRTVSQRTKPNSRTIFIGEQPNPWNLLQLQEMMSRHRGAKRPRR